MKSSTRRAADQLIMYRDAADAGLARNLLKAHHDGALRRVTRGAYVPQAAIGSGSRSERAALEYRLQVLAIARRRRAPVFTGASALALLGLPIIGDWPAEVFVMSPTGHGKREADVVEVARRGEVAITAVAGYSITSVEYSLIQTARRMPLIAALVAADAACVERRFAHHQPLSDPHRLRAEHDRLLPYHGSRRMQPVLDRVTTGAESPLETLSGVVIEELGFAPPRRQVGIGLSSARVAHVDFYWDEVGVVGEADGDVKYREPGTGPDAADRVIEEKRREDELRAQVNGLARWGWRDCWQRERLEAKLRRAGVPRIRRPRRLL